VAATSDRGGVLVHIYWNTFKLKTVVKLLFHLQSNIFIKPSIITNLQLSIILKNAG